MKKNLHITGLVAVIALLSVVFSSCDMDGDEEGDKKDAGGVAPVLSEGVADAASLSGTRAWLEFSSDKAGTYYVLVQNADATAPEASGVKTAVAQNEAGSYTGAMAAGQNTVTLTGLTAGAE
jgi:hypothetical protein